jgi:hypothetical protein
MMNEVLLSDVIEHGNLRHCTVLPTERLSIRGRDSKKPSYYWALQRWNRRERRDSLDRVYTAIGFYCQTCCR